jgi:DNA-binding XRE family transcriptional regulator
MNAEIFMTKEQKKYFWTKVDVRGKDECWNWLGAQKSFGYGNVRINRKYMTAHRVAFLLKYKKINGDNMVLHKCDNPSCCNPHHLEQGTRLQNAQQRTIRGRSVGGFNYTKQIGEKNFNCKLNVSKVRKIRKLYADRKLNQYELADKFGVTQTNIGAIVNNRTWRHA